MTRRKSNRELDREVAELEAAHAVIESGDAHSSLLPGSTDYQVVAKAVPAARASDAARWPKEDKEALQRVLMYARGFAANRGLTPVHPRLVPTDDGHPGSGRVYHSLESRHANDPSVATFSSYDRARAAVAIAEQTAQDLGIEVPGLTKGRRGR